ncbi:MAG: hypothetical protein HKN87_12215 [Saprospiraceae bacterium]|nr:hypothetical protein [Saprospiraceae bacterium]
MQCHDNAPVHIAAPPMPDYGMPTPQPSPFERPIANHNLLARLDHSDKYLGLADEKQHGTQQNNRDHYVSHWHELGYDCSENLNV